MNAIPSSADYDAVREAWRAASLSPLWESTTAHRPSAGAEPTRLWSWATLHEMAEKAIRSVSPADVERRALTLINTRPGSDTPSSTLRTLSSAIQILLPGEFARPHRHSINAIRFVMEGTGAVTVVNGKDCPMNAGDLVLTPSWTWHEHIHRGKAPVIWLDVLDGPLHRFLGVAAFEPGPVNALPAVPPDNAYASANVVPDVVLEDEQHSPVYCYPYIAVAAAVEAAPHARDGLRRVRYVNPVTGGAAISIMETSMIQIDRGGKSIPLRTTANSICCVVEGSGETQVGDKAISWGPKDIFTLPQGQWISHKAQGQDARIFVASDREVLKRLGLLEEEFES